MRSKPALKCSPVRKKARKPWFFMVVFLFGVIGAIADDSIVKIASQPNAFSSSVQGSPMELRVLEPEGRQYFVPDQVGGSPEPQEQGERPMEGSDPSDPSLLYLSTAFLPPQGAVDVKALQIAYWTLAYSPFAHTNVSVNILPFFFESVSLKQQVWADPVNRAAVALSASAGAIHFGSGDPATWLFSGNLIASRGFPDPLGIGELSIHSNMGFWQTRDRDGSERRWNGHPTFGAGVEKSIGSNTKLIAEYVGPWNLGPSVYLYDAHSVTGFLNGGLRLYGRRFFVSLGLFSTIVRDADNALQFFMFPVGAVGYRF